MEDLPEWDGEIDMDRMGKLALIVSAVAVILCGSAFIGPVDAERDGISPQDVTSTLSAIECKVGMDTANTEETVGNWLKNTWLKDINWADTNKFDVALGLSAGYDSNLSIEKVSFTAAKAGTSADKDGTSGSFVFNVKDSQGKISASNLTCTITPVFDYSSIECQVLMEDHGTEESVLGWLGQTWIGTFKTATGETGTFTVSKKEFKAPVAGTAASRSGTDGSLTFDVLASDSSVVASGLVCKILAYDFGETESSDKTVVYEGGKVQGLEVVSNDHVLTQEDIGKIVSALNGKDASPVTSLKVTTSMYTNALVIGEGDDARTYVNGDVVRFDGKEYVMLIGDVEFSLYRVDGKEWMKFERDTYDMVLDEESSRYSCSSTHYVININGVPYTVGYSVLDTYSSVITGREYICFLYDMTGKSAGYMTFIGADPEDVSSTGRFVFNKGMDPSSSNRSPVVATFTTSDGDDALLYAMASKDVRILRNGSQFAAEGNILIPLGAIDDLKAAAFFSIGDDGCKLLTISPGDSCKAVCPATTPSPLAAVKHQGWDTTIVPTDLVFPAEPGDSGGSNTVLYVAVAVVLILLVGGGFYYVRFMKP